MKQMKYLSGNV